MREPLSLWFFIKSYKFQSLFIKNFLIILALILVPVVGLSVGIYNLYSKTVTEEIGTAHLNALSRVRDMVDMMMQEVDDFSLRIASDDLVKELFSTKLSDPLDYASILSVESLYKKMNITNTTRNFIHSVYLYSEKNRFVLSSLDGRWPLDDFTDRGWVDIYNEKKQFYKEWTIPRKAKYYSTDTQERELFTLFRMAPLFQYDKSGCIIVNIDTSRFGNIISNVSNHYIDNIFIVDAEGKILYNDDFELINRPVSEIVPYSEIARSKPSEPIFIYENREGKSISHVNSLYNDWKFISVVPLKLYENKSRYIRQYLLVSSLFSIAVSLILSMIISWKAFMPIKQIMSVVNRPVDWLEPDNRSKTRLNEIRTITASIVAAYSEKQELEKELSNRLLLLNKAYAVALQSQINPHFLYNTLETINWQAMRLTGGVNQVSEMINALSRLLRFSLEGDENLVSVGAEIEHCQHYIEIQKIRYPGKIDFEWRVDDMIKRCKIPRISLQPIVENAIYHGIKPKTGKGAITVTGSLEGGAAMFRIADDGVGMNGDKVAALNAELEHKYSIVNNHIGIKNVNQRIKLTFGEPYGLTIASEQGHGTVVTVAIPARSE